ncbi:MAG: PAS domain-containing protein [Ruminococcaceae bacterium]|nr:PAS domain-containing protein [Oscillospiraceae bacterium]
MVNKIFRSNFFTSMFILLISFCLIFGVLFSYFEAQMFKELESEAGYISYAVKNEDTDFINNFNEKGKRITLVSSDGTVLADTSANADELENHADRKEIADAIKNGKGTSSRYSDTLMQKTLYYAEKLDNGTILRVSTMQNSVVIILLGLLQPLFIIIVLALIISVFLSYRLSKAIIKPINELDLDNPAANETYEELTPLLKKMSAQKKTINRQIKEAEQKQEEFRLITDNMSEGLLVIDKDANVLSYNQAVIRLLEVSDVRESSVLAFNRSKGFRNVVEKALLGERTESNISHDENTYNLIANPVYENDKIIGAVIVIIDITESVKREQLRQEFTSNVSHELKTPLTSISGFAEMMKSGGTPDETVIDFSTAIYDEAQRLITLVSDIMKISELDEGAVPATQENVDIYELSEDIVKRLTPIAEKRNISFSLIGETAKVYGVRKILDEMIYNLCDNAIKYNKENGIVDVIINRAGGKTSVTVRDTGIGIPTSEQNRVFERFYRVDKSHSKFVGGTGLGLAIVKHAAAYHGAEVSLESTEGKGTSVTIVFEQ